MGKGGIDPEYFLHKMQWWEMQLYLDGLAMRERASWEQHRSLVHSIASMLSDKGKTTKDPHAFMPLPWDDVDEEEEPEEEYPDDYVEQQQAIIAAENAKLQ